MGNHTKIYSLLNYYKTNIAVTNIQVKNFPAMCLLLIIKPSFPAKMTTIVTCTAITFLHLFLVLLPKYALLDTITSFYPVFRLL